MGLDYSKKILKEKIAQRLDPLPRLRYTLGMSNEQLIDTLYSIVDDPNNLLDGDATDAINEAIGRIGADSDEIARLHERVRDLEKRHLDASFLLADWDGYYNPDTKRGNVEELASLIEDAYRILQNKSWRDIEPDSVEEKPND